MDSMTPKSIMMVERGYRWARSEDGADGGA